MAFILKLTFFGDRITGHSLSMSRIRLLSEEVASQVAAGEVVERPAAVIKELVENSIDAHATRIEILTRRGGIALIRVTDNGVGMDRDDALLCLERHATSKIRSGADLAAIHTLGFRGEAVPSIASVSRFRLSTREHDAIAGTEVLVNGGKIEAVRDGGDAPGTQIEVRSLFYNLPARRKFLRTEATEASHVEHQLHLLALGHPQISFVHLQDERVAFQLAPANTLLDRIRDLSGAELASDLLEVQHITTPGIKISGYIGRVGISRSSRQQQLCFLNGRSVENISLSQGLREGYHTALMKGQHPVTFLFIEMDPAAVDVNVHPAKREVRFRSPSDIRNAVAAAVRAALESDRTRWSAGFRTGEPPPKEQAPAPQSQPVLPLQEQARRTMLVPASAPKSTVSNHTPSKETSEKTRPLPEQTAASEPSPILAIQPEHVEREVPPAPVPETFRFLGVLGKLFVLMENASGLVLVDQHAAHERILFEEMQRRMETQGVPSQRLLLPLTLRLGPKDSDWVERNLDLLERAGITLEGFGGGTFKVDALPTFLKAEDPVQLLHDIIDDLRETTPQGARLRLGQDMIAKTVCRHAVKANDSLREPELLKLVEDLLACDLPYCCPHGRPTMIQISYLELEKKFGRKA
ncbi:MAG: DNA mismatch repair protein MutL [Verrucomicrobia bacterium]|nr:MAG: DNA mismatch repair protein MutL [Verrucomicrobiota bacterium]